MRPIRALAPAALAFAFLVSPAAVRAELEPGVEAPDVTAQGYVNTEPLTLTQLKGRVVFLELFSTT